MMFVIAENSFSYTNQKPDYVVGKEIEENLPAVTIEGATFSIEPSFSKGLVFDEKSGKISGVPKEEYHADFTVTLTMVNGSIMTSVLEITSCGFTELNRATVLSDKYTCKSNRRVSNWSLEFEPSGDYPISISNEGILEFKNYNPVPSLSLIIKASNLAGESTNSAKILVSKTAFVYESGINIDVQQLSEFTCGVNDATATVLHSDSKVIPSLDGFDNYRNAFDNWNNALDGFLTLDGKESYTWGFTMEAYFNAPKSGKYTFHTTSDSAKWDVYIDGKFAFRHEGYYKPTNPMTYTGPCTYFDEYMTQSAYYTLTPGYHTFKMVGKFSRAYTYCYSYRGGPPECGNTQWAEGPSRFIFKWQPPSSSKSSIPFYQYKEPYDFVNYLSFENDYFTFPVGGEIEIPFKFENGKAKECFGIDTNYFTVDLTKNVIKGKINEGKSIEMSIYCKTKTSKTNEVKIMVDIVSEYVKGIVVYYLKSDDFDDSCSFPYTTTTEGVTTEIIRFENNINQPYNPLPSIWDGLTGSFMSEYGVNYEGYIKIENDDNAVNNYTFRLSSYDGSWLSIDNEEVINNGGIHDWESVEETIELSSGYHSIRVNYMKNVGGSGIELKIRENKENGEKRNNEENEFKDISNYLYFVPRSSFEYTTSYAVYIKGNKIDDNVAYIHGNGGSVSECESNPSLPPGLELSETCTIRGSPMNAQEKEVYTITGKLRNGVIANATIQISVIEEIKPQNLHVVDLDSGSTEGVKELSLLLGRESHYLVKVESGNVLYYELPIIPNGFTFNKMSGSLSVFPTEYFYNLSMEIRAYYRNDLYISKTIIANVTSGCNDKENEKVHFMILENDNEYKKDSLNIEMRDINSNEVIYEYHFEPGKVPLYSKAVCLIPGDFNVYIKDNNESEGIGNNYMYFMSDGKLADEMKIENDEIIETVINTVPKAPIFKYSSNEKVEYFYDDIISIRPTQYKLVRRCEIDPELPSCLIFDKTTCEINGIVSEDSSNTEYTIKAYNDNGITEQRISLTLHNDTMDYLCNKLGKSLIKVGINTEGSKGLCISFYLYKINNLNGNDDNDIVDPNQPIISLTSSSENWEENKEYIYSYCISESYLSGVFKSLSSDGGYGNGYVNISMNEIPITKKSLENGIKEEKENINGIRDYNYKSDWEYSSEYEDGWDNINNDNNNLKLKSEWKTSKLYELSEKEDINNKNTVYIRKISVFKDTDKYSAFSLKVSYKSGIIIKINGKELFRNNLPENVEITADTLASNMYENIVDEIFILPIPYLEEERNIISIELHKHIDEIESFPEIEVSLLRIIGTEKDCLIINKYSKPISETNTDLVGDYKVQNGFDNNANTEWYYDNSPIWAIMRFNEHYHTYFTQFGLIVNPYFKLNSFSMEVLLNENEKNEKEKEKEEEWIKLGDFSNIEYNYNKAYFTNYNTTRSYSAIKFSSNEKMFGVMDVNLNLCPVRYCNAIEKILPKTLIGSEVTIDCGDVSIPGNRTFLCKNNKEWEEIMNNCQVKPSIVSQEKKYSFTAGSYYYDIELFVVSGPNLTYSMSPEIEGMKIDEKNGKISGRPIYEQKEMIFNFKVSNSYLPEGIIIEISIEVLPSLEPILIWYNQSVSLEAGNEYKDLKFFYVTGVNVSYSVLKLPPGLKLDSKSGLINGIPTEEIFNMNCLFRVENPNLPDLIPTEFYILFNITLPNTPKNLVYEKEMNLIYYMDYEVLRPYKCIGKDVKYSVDPPLPDELKIDENDGKINGKLMIEPTDKDNDKIYTFNCYNENGEVKNPIKIHIEYSTKPILINHINHLLIEGGKEYVNNETCRVTGKNLIYQIIPELKPSTLKFNSSDGAISGYISKEYEEVNETIIISGSGGEQVSFSFLLSFEVPSEPAVIPSTKKENVTIDFNSEVKSIQLFVPVGDNIHINVEPALPKGLKLDEKTGLLSGYPLEYIEETTYKFIVKNPPSEKEEIIEITIGFKAAFCEAEDGFPQTVAIVGGKMVSIKCGSNKSGMKIRQCLLTDENKGVWGKIDDSECRMSDGVIAGIAVGSVAVGLLIVFLIVCLFLRTGLHRKRARSTALDHNRYEKEVPDKPIPEKQVAEGVRI